MARKDILKNPMKINAVGVIAHSLATSFTTDPVVIDYTDNVAIQFNIFTTNSVGSFTVEVSNDYIIQNNNVVNPGHWLTLTLSGTPSVSSANDEIGISLNQLPYSAIRVTYTSVTPGTGTCDIYFESKQVGG